MESARLLTPALVRALAALSRVTDQTSPESVLRGLTEAVARGVPGCAGCTAELWRDRRLVLCASHSELIALVDRERDLRQGPSHVALTIRAPVLIGDVLREERWPGYAATAVRHGLRSVVALPIEVEGATLVLNLYAVLPGVFAERDLAPLHSLLHEQVTVALANVWDHDHVLTDHAQMQEAMAGRAVIDQAKGIIMQASGKSAEEAFEELRRVSQHHQVKVADLARLLVTEHQRNHGGAPPP
ncbi:GAF and ANTAR domain-containing protein [Thermopolyspora sp. NPDC052614]|uniref:GAF and ANTAR domain-containing protein n=1 Tax=Thermopolyspora sp. NPDC052614 TaxID=3155682 RepID=UPI00342E6D1B